MLVLCPDFVQKSREGLDSGHGNVYTWLIFLFIYYFCFGDKLPNCMPAKMKLQAVKLLGYPQDIYQLHVT